MVTVQQIAIEKLSMYFFMSVLDEDKAQEAIRKVWQDLNTKTLNWKRVPKRWEQSLIAQSNRVHSQMNSVLAIRRSGLLQNAFIEQPNIDWTDWFEFLKIGKANEVSIVLWVKVLGFKQEDVASALKITEGTVRYRLNKGLMCLGQILEGEANA